MISQAEGDADRFARQLAEYQKAPQVTRERLYIDTMREVYSNITKVMIDAHNNTSLLAAAARPAAAAGGGGAAAPSAGAPAAAAPSVGEQPPASATVDVRSRENQRGRDRDSR